MGGLVEVDKGINIFLPNTYYNALVEYPRSFFHKSYQDDIKEVYRPMDEEGCECISLIDQGHTGFNAYYQGFIAAYEYSIAQNKCGQLSDEMFGPVMKKWKEVIDILEQDERFDPDFTL